MGLRLFQARTSVPSRITEMDFCSFANSFLVNDLLLFIYFFYFYSYTDSERL